DLLGREAEPAGLAYWAAVLDRGATRAAVALGIETSPEGRARAVQEVYLRDLRRGADAAGPAPPPPLPPPRAAPAARAARAGVLGSPESLGARGGGTDAGFLAALYRDALGRPLDPAGQAGWGQVLAAAHLPPATAGGRAALLGRFLVGVGGGAIAQETNARQ